MKKVIRLTESDLTRIVGKVINEGKKKKDSLPPKTIKVGVYYYKDEEGNMVFDTEEMQKEFEFKLKEIEKEFKK